MRLGELTPETSEQVCRLRFPQMRHRGVFRRNAKEQNMSNHQFIECLSSDPFIRSLGRQVSRLMNDPTLGTHQRQRLVSKVQEKLLAYQASQIAKTLKKADNRKRESTTRSDGSQVTADPKGVAARRKEFQLFEVPAKAPASTEKPATHIAANDGHIGGWHRPLLTLKRA